MKQMTLRELIDRLEELSKNGRNDGLTVHAVGDDGMIDMDVTSAWIDRFVGPVEVYDYIKLDLN